ncbi:DUF6868 family protein [Mariprofundus ferrooxydans]|uniref:DUF6868 domain-containing protein n=1 Tax=Mariprofundus ferrooxydans PV-1 TaxID=314345 RepID=Q0EXB1_9PROT|nr:hypothetical protein [Mariprofundus ferrooxydans]EAU53879.1 hypothetical protein SPV1_08076 [Mariprofundus ferrooxydans PV-1]
MVTIDTIRDVLLYCALINMGLLLWWALFFIFAHDFVYRMHSRWFSIPSEKFDAIHYTGMAFYKICIFLFNIAPWIALKIVA